MIKYLLAILLLSCSTSTEKIKLQYNPPATEKIIYSFALHTGKSTMYMEIEFQPKLSTKDTIIVNTNIRKMEWRNGDSIDKEMSSGLSSFVNLALYFKMNPQGVILESLSHTDLGDPAPNIFDVKLFFPDYPAGEITEGYSWKNERKIEDMLYKSVKTDFKLTKADGETASLKVKYVYVDPSKFVSKEMAGEYIINKTTGLIQSGSFKIDGFNGYGKMFGTLEIKRIDQ